MAKWHRFNINQINKRVKENGKVGDKSRSRNEIRTQNLINTCVCTKLPRRSREKS